MGDFDEVADSVIPPISTFITRLRDTAPQLPQSAHSNSTFYRNLDEVLDVRRTTGLYWSVVENQWQVGDAADFCSGDICKKLPYLSASHICCASIFQLFISWSPIVGACRTQLGHLMNSQKKQKKMRNL